MMHTSSVVDLMHTGLAAYLDTLFPGEGLRVLQAQPPLGGRSCNLRPAKLPQKSPTQAHFSEPFAPEPAASLRYAAVHPIEARSSPKLRPVIGDESSEEIDCFPSTVMVDARTSKKRSQSGDDDDEEVLSESGSAVSTACGSDEASPFARLTTTRSADS